MMNVRDTTTTMPLCHRVASRTVRKIWHRIDGDKLVPCGFNCPENKKDNDIYVIHTYMKMIVSFLKICQHTCRFVAAVFRSGHPVHVKYLLHARRAGVSCELCSCDLSV